MEYSREDMNWMEQSLESICRQALANMDAYDIEYVSGLIRANEYSLAMEGLAASLLAGGHLCPPAALPTFRALATKLDLLENGFIRALLQGRREMPPDEELPPI